MVFKIGDSHLHSLCPDIFSLRATMQHSPGECAATAEKLHRRGVGPSLVRYTKHISRVLKQTGSQHNLDQKAESGLFEVVKALMTVITCIKCRSYKDLQH